MRNSKDDHRLFVIKHYRYQDGQTYYLTDLEHCGGGAGKPKFDGCLICAAHMCIEAAQAIVEGLARDQMAAGTFWLVPLVITEGEPEPIVMGPALQ